MEAILMIIAGVFYVVLFIIMIVIITLFGWIAVLIDVFGDKNFPHMEVVYWTYSVEAVLLGLLVVSGTWREFIQKLHFMLSPHPARGAIKQSSSGRPLDCDNLASALTPTRREDLPPVFVSQNRAQQARAYAERLHAERELMNEAVERERSRARLSTERGHRP